jgi:hypothetical protein
LGVLLLVGLGGELEGCVEVGFRDFVVVVEEFLGFSEGIGVICPWSELVSMLHGVLANDRIKKGEEVPKLNLCRELVRPFSSDDRLRDARSDDI